MAKKRGMEKDLNKTQRKELIAALHQKRDELQHALRRRRTGSSNSGDRSGDEADQASEDADVALETRLMDRDAKLLREVERALRKVDQDNYGYCEGTDEPIGYARLKSRPWTRYSVVYKEELEREQSR